MNNQPITSAPLSFVDHQPLGQVTEQTSKSQARATAVTPSPVVTSGAGLRNVPAPSQASSTGTSGNNVQQLAPRAAALQTVAAPVPASLTDSAILKIPVQESKATKTGPAAACIPKGVKFTGEAFIAGDMQINGNFVGKLNAGSTSAIEISSTGHVQGDIEALDIIVLGEAHGNLMARQGRVSFGENAICTGHVTAAKLRIEEGAFVDATTKMIKKTEITQ